MTPTAGSYPVLATRRKTEHVDWRKIAALNIEQMYQTFDYNILQDNIYSVTFCDIELEVDNKSIDPNYIKLFKLSQLIIEYLLNSQDYLTHQLGCVDERIKKHEQKENELKEKIGKLQHNLSKVSKESHKRKKLLMAQQQLIHGTPGNYHKCPFCPKAFLHHSYLQNHLTKRHNGMNGVPSVITDGESSSGHGSGSRSMVPIPDTKNVAMEKELKLLKDQLLAFEERDAQKHKEITNLWKQFQDRDLQYEANIKELMQRFSVKPTNLGVIRNDDDDDDDYKDAGGGKDQVDTIPETSIKNLTKPAVRENCKRRKSAVLFQQENNNTVCASPKKDSRDLAVFKKETKQSEKLMQIKIQNMEKNFSSCLKEQERKWQMQMEEIKKKHKEELLQAREKIHLSRKKTQQATKAAKKLNFSQKSKKSTAPKQQVNSFEEKTFVETFSLDTDSIKDTNRVVDMVEEIHENKDNLYKKADICADADDDSEEEEDDVDDDDDSEDDYNDIDDKVEEEDGVKDKQRNKDVNHNSIKSVYDSQSYNEMMMKMYKQVTENPKILKEMRSEMVDLLSEKLDKIGFPAATKAISTKSFQDKMALLKKDRVNKAKKYPGFYHERNRLDDLVSSIAKKKLQANKNLMKDNNKGTSRASKTGSLKHSVKCVSKKTNSNKKPKKQQKQQQSSIQKQKHISYQPSDAFATHPVISKAEIHPQGTSNLSELVPSIQKSVPAISKNPPNKAASNWNNDSDKEESESWTDSEISSLLNDEPSNTKVPVSPQKGSVSASHQLSHRIDNSKKQPVPLPRRNVSTDFDADDSDLDIDNNITGISRFPPTVTPSKGTKVAEIGNKIKSQLENRPTIKLSGAVDLMKKPEDPEADDSDFSKISFLDEDIDDNKFKNPKYTSTPAGRVILDTEASTNTYSTSKWGTSSKGFSMPAVSSLSSFDSN
ncbi:hypothetical protein Ahia01_000274400 [Argonauta hians]